MLVYVLYSVCWPPVGPLLVPRTLKHTSKVYDEISNGPSEDVSTGNMRSFFAQQNHLGVLNYVIDCLDFMNI